MILSLAHQMSFELAHEMSAQRAGAKPFPSLDSGSSGRKRKRKKRTNHLLIPPDISMC
jgi:hypothetical protein